ncbi:UNVERIFIED_CONTAM: hypothetical protein FKN15_042853 [Acipenser sinensis]
MAVTRRGGRVCPLKRNRCGSAGGKLRGRRTPQEKRKESKALAVAGEKPWAAPCMLTPAESTCVSEIVGAKNVFKPKSPELPYLILHANGVVSFNPGEGLFATVLVVDASTPSVCTGTIAENFQVHPGSSVIITACREIVPRKSDQDNEWVDEDGNNHKTA